MSKRNSKLERLLNPRSVAVIGAGGKPGQVGRIIFESLRRSDRPVYPVNHSGTSIFGQKVFKRIEDVSDGVDLAVIAVNAEDTILAAESCGKIGIPFVIAVAGGFSETGPSGLLLEKRLIELTHKYNIRILGPNTLGIFAPHERLDTIFVEHGDRALGAGGGVAFISQSGSVGVEALGVASNIGFGLRAFIGLGNKIDLDELDFLGFFENEERTTCVALYLESIKQGRAFLHKAGETSLKKPILALKTGRTDSGKIAVSSHTGNLSGTDNIVEAAFRQNGIQRVDNDEELSDCARILAAMAPPPGNRIAIVTAAGGFGVMAADEIEKKGKFPVLEVARFSPQTKDEIKRLAPSFASIENPVDLSANATDDIFIGVLDIISKDAEVDIILCIATFAPFGLSDALIRRIASLTGGLSKPVVAVIQHGPFTNGHISRLFDYGVIGYPSVSRGVRAIRRLVERSIIKARLSNQESNTFVW